MKFATVISGWCIVNFKGQQAIFKKKMFSIFSLKITFGLANCADPVMKCHMMQHFIRVNNVCKSSITRLG